MTIGRLIRIAIIPTLAFAWVVLQYIQLDGERTVVWRSGARSPFINSPLPAERVEIGPGNSVRLQADPVYFHVTPPPGRWQTVTVAADINPQAQPVIEFGPVTNPRLNHLDLRPAYHSVLENLGPEWESVLKDGLLVAKRTGASITSETTRIYRAPSPEFARKTWTLGRSQVLPADLAGGHEWWVYGQAGEVLTWSANVIDQNLSPGPDDLALIIMTADGQELERAALSDSDSDESRVIQVSASLPETGAYRIILSSTSDITWLQNTTNAQYLAAKNQLRLASQAEVDIWTTAAVVGVEEPVGKRAIGLGEGVHKLEDLMAESAVVGDGYFSFTRGALWSPTLTPLTQATDLSKINQIIATKPSLSQTFNFSSLHRDEQGSFRLVLSLPNVQSLLAADQPLLQSLTVTFKK